MGDKGREGQKAQKMGDVINGRPLRIMAAFLSNIPCIVLTSFQVEMLQNCVYILHTTYCASEFSEKKCFYVVNHFLYQ